MVTPIVKSYINSYKDLPVTVYQIQNKFRNEARAKSGIMRGREFRMKDLYSFHPDQDSFAAYYEQVKQVYVKIFEEL
jgi:prolyl-tRNA synthetase